MAAVGAVVGRARDDGRRSLERVGDAPQGVRCEPASSSSSSGVALDDIGGRIEVVGVRPEEVVPVHCGGLRSSRGGRCPPLCPRYTRPLVTAGPYLVTMSIIHEITSDTFERAAAGGFLLLTEHYGMAAGEAAEAAGALAALTLAQVDRDSAIAAVAGSLGVE